MTFITAGCIKESKYQNRLEIFAGEGKKRWVVTQYFVEGEDRTSSYNDSCNCDFIFERPYERIGFDNCNLNIIGWNTGAAYSFSEASNFVVIALSSKMQNFDIPYHNHSVISWQIIIFTDHLMIWQTNSDGKDYVMYLEAG